MTVLAAVFALSACVSLEGVSIPSGVTTASGQSADNLVRYQCENGYRVSVNYKSVDEISISFNNGQDIYVTTAKISPAASGSLYVNDLGNLRWHEKNGVGVFNYPASDWRSSGRVLETTCQRPAAN